MPKHYWLFKSEPEVCSIDDLKRDGTTCWEGVRNYQARNCLRDGCAVGDEVLFYHSNSEPTGLAGVAKIVRAGYADHTAVDPKDPHYDPKTARGDNPWVMVDIGFVEKFAHIVSLDELRAEPRLAGLLVIKRGQRLSIQPVEPEHFKLIVKMGRVRT